VAKLTSEKAILFITISFICRTRDLRPLEHKTPFYWGPGELDLFIPSSLRLINTAQHTPHSNAVVVSVVCMVQSGIRMMVDARHIDSHIDSRSELHTDHSIHMDDDTMSNTKMVASIYMGVVLHAVVLYSLRKVSIRFERCSCTRSIYCHNKTRHTSIVIIPDNAINYDTPMDVLG